MNKKDLIYYLNNSSIDIMIYITGDLHGPNDIHKLNSKNFLEGNSLSKDDYLIILGDFGLIWSVNKSSKEEKFWLDWLSNKKWTTLFIDGNHENFDRLLKYPEISMFNNKVGKITESIYHLKRSRIYTIENKTFFTLGGANSIDKIYRTPYISWWKQECPNYLEMKQALNLLTKNKVDYILTHDAPQEIVKKIDLIYEVEDNYRIFLDELNSITLNSYKNWFFGHYHDNMNIGKFILLYDKIIKLVEKLKDNEIHGK